MSSALGEPNWQTAKLTRDIIESEWRDQLTARPDIVLRRRSDSGATRKGLKNVASKDYIIISVAGERGQEWTDVGRNVENLSASSFVTIQSPKDADRVEELYNEMRYIYKTTRSRYESDRLEQSGWDTLDVSESERPDEAFKYWSATFTFRYEAVSRYTTNLDNFDVTVGMTMNATNSPVDEGQTLTVDADIENTGGEVGTQDVLLLIENVEKDSETVTLEPGATETVTLEWATEQGDAADYDAVVTSDDDRDSVSVTVNDV